MSAKPHPFSTGRRPFRFLLLALFASSVSVACAGEHSAEIPIRIGWQTPWATQGQLVQVLKHTDALARNGLHGTFHGFSYGAPLNEAALAGDVDVILTADQPAVMLLARAPRWRIVGRLMYNRVALYVPPESPIHTVADLRGKTVAMPFGAAAQREALRAFEAAGLDPRRDVRTINLDIYEQSAVVGAGTRARWGEIDALAGFDPTVAMFERQGLARMLHIAEVVALVLVSEDYLRQHHDAAQRLLVAMHEAYAYYATHPAQANAWFRQEARMEMDDSVLALAAKMEPNLKARRPQEVSLSLSVEDLRRIQSTADFLLGHGLIAHPVRTGVFVDTSYLARAEAGLATRRQDGDGLRILVPRTAP